MLSDLERQNQVELSGGSLRADAARVHDLVEQLGIEVFVAAFPDLRHAHPQIEEVALRQRPLTSATEKHCLRMCVNDDRVSRRAHGWAPQEKQRATRTLRVTWAETTSIYITQPTAGLDSRRYMMWGKRASCSSPGRCSADGTSVNTEMVLAMQYEPSALLEMPDRSHRGYMMSDRDYYE